MAKTTSHFGSWTVNDEISNESWSCTASSESDVEDRNGKRQSFTFVANGSMDYPKGWFHSGLVILVNTSLEDGRSPNAKDLTVRGSVQVRIDNKKVITLPGSFGYGMISVSLSDLDDSERSVLETQIRNGRRLQFIGSSVDGYNGGRFDVSLSGSTKALDTHIDCFTSNNAKFTSMDLKKWSFVKESNKCYMKYAELGQNNIVFFTDESIMADLGYPVLIFVADEEDLSEMLEVRIDGYTPVKIPIFSYGQGRSANGSYTFYSDPESMNMFIKQYIIDQNDKSVSLAYNGKLISADLDLFGFDEAYGKLYSCGVD